MEWVETTGRSLDEAKDAALDQLGVDESDAEFVIVTEPKPGLFGRVRGEARVRARVRPTQPRPKRGRERRQGSSSGSKRQTSVQAEPGTSEVGGEEGDAFGENPEDQALVREASASALTSLDAQTSTVNPADDPVAGSPRPSNRRRNPRSRPSAQAAKAQWEEAADADAGLGKGAALRTDTSNSHTRRGYDPAPVDGAPKEDPMADMTVQEQGEAARDFVDRLVTQLGLVASVAVHPVDQETVTVAVDGDGLGILVGRGGVTLQALQELTRTYVQKITGGQSDRILVDVAGYRAKRVAALQRFATNIASEVSTTGESRALEPMSPADRKVVHDTVNAIPGVATRSEGEDQRRYVLITPIGADES